MMAEWYRARLLPAPAFDRCTSMLYSLPASSLARTSRRCVPAEQVLHPTLRPDPPHVDVLPIQDSPDDDLGTLAVAVEAGGHELVVDQAQALDSLEVLLVLPLQLLLRLVGTLRRARLGGTPRVFLELPLVVFELHPLDFDLFLQSLVLRLQGLELLLLLLLFLSSCHRHLLT